MFEQIYIIVEIYRRFKQRQRIIFVSDVQKFFICGGYFFGDRLTRFFFVKSGNRIIVHNVGYIEKTVFRNITVIIDVLKKINVISVAFHGTGTGELTARIFGEYLHAHLAAAEVVSVIHRFKFGA